MGMGIERQIEDYIRPVLEKNRFELVDTQYRREGGKWVLRFFIDKPLPAGQTVGQIGSSVTLADCEKMSNVIGDALDASQLVGDSYVLEVSSPGINRPLKSEADFLKYIGQKAKVSLFAPLPGSIQKNFTGFLMGFENGELDIDDVTSGRVKLPLSMVAKANLDLV